MAGDGRSASATTTGRRVVMFPFPFVSHITPMLQLAELLRARGLGVTVLHADLNAPDPALHPDLTFVSIRESLPDDFAAAACPDLADQTIRLNDACEAPFQSALAAELARDGGGEEKREVACAVVDAQWYKMLGAARLAGVPALALRSHGGAAAFLTVIAAINGGDRLDEVVPGLEPLRDETALCRFIAAAVRDTSSGVVLNTFDAIEAPELAMIRREISPLPAFPVGPLHLLSPSPPPAATDHGGCLAWLDARPPCSVLYVSVATIDLAAFEEMAWGLAGSGVPFLWALPRGSVVLGAGAADSDAPPSFPEELEETVRRRGKVVAWAPQREVLAHPSVGGFWTRGGWSSTTEAVYEGVPMLVQPRSGDHEVTARYVARRWGVGFDVGRVVERTAMARAIRRLMAARELGPHAPRKRASLLKMQARQCLEEGGSASKALDDLVEYMHGIDLGNKRLKWHVDAIQPA